MTRLIDADELKTKVLKEGTSYILTIIDNAPTVTFSKEICSGCGRYIREKEEADNEQ